MDARNNKHPDDASYSGLPKETALHVGRESLFKIDEEHTMDAFGRLLKRMSFVFWCAMVFGGFCSPFPSKRGSIAYRWFWVACFTTCFLTCFSNCFVKDPPFHSIFPDLMVALVHVPGLYSIFFWNALLDDNSCAAWKLVRRTQMYPETEAKLTFLCQCLAPLLFPAQLAVVGLVWAGYAWPTELYLLEEPHDIEAQVHAKSMWIVIPPVVANVVANAAFFAFFSYAHYLQVEQELTDLTDGEAETLAASDRDEPSTREGEAELDEAMNNLFRVQDELDESCKQWSTLVSIFVAWALGALIAVTVDLIEFLSQDDPDQFTIWVFLIDLFLGVAAMLFVVGFLVLGAFLTENMDEFCMSTVRVMRSKKIPTSKVAAAYNLLRIGGRTSGLGFKIFGTRIDWPFVAGFLSLIVTGLGLVLATLPKKGSSLNLRDRAHR